MKNQNDIERAIDLATATREIRMALVYADLDMTDRTVATLRNLLKYLDERNKERDRAVFPELNAITKQ